jgi:hypothetical protein
VVWNFSPLLAVVAFVVVWVISFVIAAKAGRI